jgi:hypothetical protein
MKNLFLPILLLLALAACTESAKIQVQNNIHNSRMENINFGSYGIYSSLLPGETSDELTITELRKEWPMRHYLEFYLVANNKQVYLRTQEMFTLDYDDELLIVIDDTTVVLNPLN